mmetsp:Transcript_11765/g.14281  ORF Transcript_11765/g.14281 Transcript_11765/m.14281 type:complete len:273 (+) Transcript_11765:99-917(+)
MKRSTFIIRWVLLGVVAYLSGLVSVGPGGLRLTQAAKGKSKKKPKTILSGASPAGATKWLSDSAGSVYTDVDLSHLQLDRTPRILCSVSIHSKGFAYSGYESKKDDGVFSAEALALKNVTGKNYPRKVTPKGFRVRLKYDATDGRNLTAATPRIGGWRVRWVAITNDHEISKSLSNSNDDVNPEYLNAPAYIKMLKKMVEEDREMVHELFGREYELPLSQQPKPKISKTKKASKSSSESETSEEKSDAQEADESETAAGASEEDSSVKEETE